MMPYSKLTTKSSMSPIIFINPTVLEKQTIYTDTSKMEKSEPNWTYTTQKEKEEC